MNIDVKWRIFIKNENNDINYNENYWWVELSWVVCCFQTQTNRRIRNVFVREREKRGPLKLIKFFFVRAKKNRWLFPKITKTESNQNWKWTYNIKINNLCCIYDYCIPILTLDWWNYVNWENFSIFSLRLFCLIKLSFDFINCYWVSWLFH